MDQTTRPASAPARPTRRAVLGAGAAGAALTLPLGVASPAQAATVPSLRVRLTDPTVDPVTWQYVKDQPVYAYRSATVRFRAAAPSGLVVTNGGDSAVTGASGLLEASMWNYDHDAASTPLNHTIVGPADRSAVFSPATGPARLWSWTWTGVLAPGASVTVPLRYEVGSALGSLLTATFSQYRYNLLLSASVQDPTTGAELDRSERVAFFEGTTATMPEL